MKAHTGNTLTVRMDKDVELLVELAMKRGGWKNPNRLANNAIRSLLTPIVDSKRVRDLQEKMGVKP